MGQFGVGQAVRRFEDRRLLTGHGQYTDDISVEGQCYGYVVRSPLAHARIASIDVEAARRSPGVLAVYTGADFKAAGVKPIPCMAVIPGRDGKPVTVPEYEIIATDRVRHIGNPLAFIVATTLEAAHDAAELVEVDYEDLPAVTDAPAALAADAPVLHEGMESNLCLDFAVGDEAGTQAAFAKAAKVAKLELVNNRVVVNAMEPRAALAAYDAEKDRMTFTAGNQGIFRLRQQMADAIGLDPEKLHMVCPDVGGGFGMKIFLFPEMVMTLYAARDLGRAVKWTADRSESFLADTQGRDHVSTAELAMDEEGRFLGLRVTTLANMGAYLSNFAPYIPTGASTPMLSGLYKIPAIFANVKCVFTNTVPVDAYRGAGRPEAAYLVERIVDEAARVAGKSPMEIRHLNFIKPEDLPYDTKLGRIYDSGDFSRMLDQATKLADYDGFAARKAAAARRGKRLGFGLGCYVEACSGIGEEEATVTVERDGGITLVIGTQTNGQGHLTAYAQLLNEKLGIDPEKVKMVQGDSDLVQRGGGTGGSRSLLMGGVAINRASDKIIERARHVAGHLMEAASADMEFADGIFTVAGTDRRVTLAEVAAAVEDGKVPQESGPLRDRGDYTAEAMTYPNGCHCCEVEVDEATGAVEIVRYTVVDDFGTLVNPLLVAGQVHGGTVQGLGQALLEHTVYDESGQLVTGSYMDYCMPRADNLPHIDLTLVEDMPCATNPMGVKGAGEAGAIGAPPAIINAVVDALSPLGVRHLDMPATPERVWRALRAA